MSRKSLVVFTVAGLSLALGACGSSESTAPEAATTPEIALSPIQKANFERFNRKDFLVNLKTLQEKAAESGSAAEGSADFAALDNDGDISLSQEEFAAAKPAGDPESVAASEVSKSAS